MDHDAWQPPDGGTVTRTPDGAYRTDWDLRTNLRSRSRYFTDERIKGEGEYLTGSERWPLGRFFHLHPGHSWARTRLYLWTP